MNRLLACWLKTSRALLESFPRVPKDIHQFVERLESEFRFGKQPIRFNLVPHDPPAMGQKLGVIVRAPNNLVPRNPKQLLEIIGPWWRVVVGVMLHVLPVSCRVCACVRNRLLSAPAKAAIACANRVRRISDRQVKGKIRQRAHVLNAVAVPQFAIPDCHFLSHHHSVVTFCLPTRRSSGTRRDKAASRPLAMRFPPAKIPASCRLISVRQLGALLSAGDGADDFCAQAHDFRSCLACIKLLCVGLPTPSPRP